MTEEDWKSLMSRAASTYRKGAFCPITTRDDFVQYCALNAMKTLHKFNEFNDANHFISSVIGFSTKDWRYSDHNIKEQRGFPWSTFRHEISVEEIDDRSDMAHQRLDDALHNKLTAEKFLSGWEQKILDLYKEGYTHSQIGEKLFRSGERVRQILEGIKIKLAKYN